MSEGKTVLVLGGGVGGVVTARELRKLLPAPHRVVLVEREREHLFAPSLLWLMVGMREAKAIRRPLAELAKKGLEVRTGEIEAIDPVARRVTVSGEALAADYLVVTLGADLAPETIPGLAKAGHNFYGLAGAESLWAALRSFQGGRIVVLTAAPAYKCPAAPYEAAMLLDHYVRAERRLEVSTAVYAAEPAPMGVAGPHVSAAVRELLATKGIAYHPEHQVTQVDPQARRITFANGAHADYDLLAYVPPHRAPRVVREAGLTGASGWISVDRHTLETSHPQVYALGDVVSIPLTLGKPLPKAGVFAHGQATVVAQNLALAITGQGEPARFDGHGECFIETGGGAAGFGSGNFYGEPKPEVELFPPAVHFHLAKVLFEKTWLTFTV
ncbi:MAG: NAD(P)/FAD-dependent oxidoreductase [Deltaproteobacteria bacterium]|nr:NAD(P)/FAD-dependent oxidoreductase [Deltaproteobacteria bacterium]